MNALEAAEASLEEVDAAEDAEELELSDDEEDDVISVSPEAAWSSAAASSCTMVVMAEGREFGGEAKK